MAPAKSDCANAIHPNGASRRALRGAGFPPRPKKNPGVGLMEASEWIQDNAGQYLLLASNPEDPNISSHLFTGFVASKQRKASRAALLGLGAILLAMGSPASRNQ